MSKMGIVGRVPMLEPQWMTVDRWGGIVYLVHSPCCDSYGLHTGESLLRVVPITGLIEEIGFRPTAKANKLSPLRGGLLFVFSKVRSFFLMVFLDVESFWEICS